MRRLLLGLLFGGLLSGLASAQSLEQQVVQVYRQEYLAGRTLAAGQVVACAYREGPRWRQFRYGRASCSVFAREQGQGVTVTGQADDLRVTVGPRGALTLESPGLTTFERDTRRLFPWWVRQWQRSAAGRRLMADVVQATRADAARQLGVKVTSP